MSDNLTICLVSTGVAMPLLQFVLSEQPYKLSVAELKRLIVICGQEPERGRKKEVWHRQLLTLVVPGIVEETMQALLKLQPVAQKTMTAMIEAELRKCPDMAIGVNLMKENDPAAMDDFREVNKVLNTILGNTDADQSSEDTSSANSSSSSESSSSNSPRAPLEKRPKAYVTPDVLKRFVPHAAQAVWQDLRENRFKGHDRRDGDGKLPGRLMLSLVINHLCC